MGPIKIVLDKIIDMDKINNLIHLWCQDMLLNYHNRHADRFFAIIGSLILSFIPFYVTGPDYWAETFAEYFDTIKGLNSLFNVGWGGYYSFFPQFVSAIYHEILFSWFEPWGVARLFSSVVIFSCSFLMLYRVLDANIHAKHLVYLLVFTSLLWQVLHPSTNSIISVGYFLYLPLFVSMLFDDYRQEPYSENYAAEKILFLVALLTKPSLLFLTVFFGLKRDLIFKLICLGVFLFQYYLTKVNAGPLSVTIEADLQYLLSVSAAAFKTFGLIVSHSLFFDCFSSYSFSLGLVVTFFLLFGCLIHHKASAKTFLLLSAVLASTIPFVFLNLIDNPKLDDFKLTSLTISLAKAQYWIIPSTIVPLVCLMVINKFNSKKLIIFFLGLAILNQVALSRHQLSLANSSNVNTSSIIANQVPSNQYWRCFPILPYPGFPLDELKKFLLIHLITILTFGSQVAVTQR